MQVSMSEVVSEICMYDGMYEVCTVREEKRGRGEEGSRGVSEGAKLRGGLDRRRGGGMG